MELDPPTKTLKIYNHNINGSDWYQHALTNMLNEYDIMTLQEPHVNFMRNTIATRRWDVVYPDGKYLDPPKSNNTRNRTKSGKTKDVRMRSVILVSKRLASGSWEPLSIKHSWDITGIKVTCGNDKYFIFSVYNDCERKNTRTVQQLSAFCETHEEISSARATDDPNTHIIWIGDFNRHDPMWDSLDNCDLFTNEEAEGTQPLLEAAADLDLYQILPKGTTTHENFRTGRWSCLDLVWVSNQTRDRILKCEADPDQKGASDHFPILLTIDSTPTEAPLKEPTHNFRGAEWDKVLPYAQRLFDKLPEPTGITTNDEVQERAKQITDILQKTIKNTIPLNKPALHAKRWWNSDLTRMWKELKAKKREAHKLRGLANNPAKGEVNRHTRAFREAIKKAKSDHWDDWLANAEEPDIWRANKYISDVPGDGSQARIPPLRYRDDKGEEQKSENNEVKSKLLADVFFPPPPPPEKLTDYSDFSYPNPVEDGFHPPTREQILRNISNLKPFKAPGPDGIPNVMIQKTAHMMVDHLYFIFKAIFELETYVDAWKESNTIVLRKPGKPNYDIAKAYRPIALLNTLGKVLAACVAENLTFIAEKHNLLPPNTFGGRPGRTAPDLLHLVVQKVKDAWRARKVVTIFFMDIAGAFPNAVRHQLLHDMRNRRVPEQYVSFIDRMLMGRSTRLFFDDHQSESMPITNGIGQGDPLSMVLYLFYSADLMQVSEGRKNECTPGFVDDASTTTIGDTFIETHAIVADIHDRDKGLEWWCRTHNSSLEILKCAHMDLAPRSSPHRPLPLTVGGATLQPVVQHRMLGIIIDRQLTWHAQAQTAATKARTAALQLRRIAKPTKGIKASFVRRMYYGAVVPRVLYGADVWLTPIHTVIIRSSGRRREVGSIGFIKKLAQAQRIAALTIAGAFRTAPTDSIEAHLNMLPIQQLVDKHCHRAIIRMMSLPKDHPLTPYVQKCSSTRDVKRHRTPIQKLAQLYGLHPKDVETIYPVELPPWDNFVVDTVIQPREAAEAAVDQDKADVKVFTDGSGYKGGVGAAAVAYSEGRKVEMLTYHLGKLSEHTVHEAEVVGLILASKLAETVMRNRSTKTVSIYVDNEAAIRGVNNRKNKAAQSLLHAFRNKARALGKKYPRKTITIHWAPAHAGIEGNEAADKAAKKAAEGSTSVTEKLPNILRRTLPANVSALKQEHNSKLVEKHKRSWEGSSRSSRIKKLGLTLPSNAFTKLAEDLPRLDAATLIQMRTGHFPLNAYLFKMGKVDRPNCPACGEPQETVQHFLEDCHKHARERWHLKRAAGTEDIMRFALSTKKGAAALKIFIRGTRRFQHGTEVTPLDRHSRTSTT